MENKTEWTAFRRCNVAIPCSKCGVIIPKGSPNVDWNTRNSSLGKYHNDCSKPAGWNAKQQRTESVEEYQREGSKEVVTTAKFSGKCNSCGKPTIQGITAIKLCRDGKTWIHTFCSDNTSETTEQTYTYQTPVIDVPTVKAEPTMNPTMKTTETLDAPKDPLLAMIWEGIKPYIATVETDSKKLNSTLEAIEEMMSELERKITQRPIEALAITRIDLSTATIESPHPQLKLLLFVAGQCRQWAYLYGPAGSGKSSGAKAVATALNLPFYAISLNKLSTPTLVTGFLDVNRIFSDPDFYKAYKDGGVYLIDEMDNASGNLLTTLNSALANGFMFFPGVGEVKQHADFICIATGNTTGRGADRQYNDRQQLDAATIDRFNFIEWGYDEASEMKWALAKNPNAANWVKIVQAIRAKALTNGVRIAVTPRASINGAIMLAHAKACDFTLYLQTLLNLTVYKGLDRDTISKIEVKGMSL